MRLWTIQPIEVYNTIISTGIYHCDISKSSFCNDDMFMEAYSWMKSKLIGKCGVRDGCSDMIWAWYARNGKHKKPDLREGGYDKRGNRCVCIEIEIPDAEVLLSDFENWHCVLNKSYCDDSQSEDEWNQIMAWYDSLPCDEANRVMVESWDNIFNITKYENEWRKNGYYVQAVFWEIRAENIVDVRYFTAK